MKPTTLTALLATAASVLAQVPLEPPNGKILFGPWYDRLHGDTPSLITQRLGHAPSMFQSDINMTDTLQMPTEFIRQVDDTHTDTILYLTVYPIMGFDAVNDNAIRDLAGVVADQTKKGRRVFMRYASEMNGGWFRYGQQPTKFLASWKKVTDIVRAAVTDKHLFAVVWAPNASNGYPFAGGEYSVHNTSADWSILDTNGDGLLTADDDPYSPYYPGDDYVDWVGFSAYHYGSVWPWEQNVLPVPGQIEFMLTGTGKWGNFSMYHMFCEDGSGGGVQPPVSNGGKPFMITETGGTYHMYINGKTGPAPDGVGRVALKQAWWKQFLNKTFIAKFPKYKAISTFEFQKYEETTLRDFTTLGPHNGTYDPFTTKSDQDQPVLEAFKKDVATYDFIIWANVSGQTGGNAGGGGDSKTGTDRSTSAGERSLVGWATILGVAVGGLVSALTMF
ncbi:hypothetical protein HK097_009102 [Rhizophlyctis rosea]|uniref:GH26 domain-containing protein n=1 Tax=Rhizophlyctis rosea TaxID=64517 RepID=A0AAD5SBL4_9FUNG|nr:hypothetical protein HK097_009102 [Rhizophlyctis rosea]